MPYRHIVLFRLHDDLDDTRGQEALALLRRLGEQPGVLEWRVEESLDERKGRVLVECGLFEDEASFEAFRASDAHRAAVAVMREISDWLVGDYVE